MTTTTKFRNVNELFSALCTDEMIGHLSRLSGQVTVVVAEAPTPDVRGTLVALGWNGVAPAFGLSHAKARRLAADFDRQAEHPDSAPKAAFLRRRRSDECRVLAFAATGCLWITLTERGFAVEPGTCGDLN